jgi:hypothetical protein
MKLIIDSRNFTNAMNDYPTTKRWVCYASGKGAVSNTCAVCISHTISHGTTQPSMHLRLVQDIRAESVYCKQSVLLRLLCLMQLWISFGLSSKDIHKNQHSYVILCEILCEFQVAQLFLTLFFN